jgi:hypothetical protein
LSHREKGGWLRVSDTALGAAGDHGPSSLRSLFLPSWDRLASFETWAISLAIFALNRTYVGITGDAILYIGRGLANLDPNGVGRDLIFREDGQSAFSVYGTIITHLIPYFGPGGTGMLLAALGLITWIAALAVLSRRLATGRARAAILLMVAFLPFSYGAYGVFAYAEPLAVPRSFAEAGVLAGLTALIARRNLLAFACMALAALFHPIMALAGFAVVSLILCLENKRWLMAGAVLLASLLAAAALGLPVASRLYEVFDSQWWDILTYRHPYLFPTRWPLEAYTPLVVQATTIGIAASFTEGRVRAILCAALAIAFAGLSASAIFGDWLRLVLVVQVQLWRPAWLVAVLGAVSLALCASELWRRGGAFRLAFAVLVIAWVHAASMPTTALCVCTLAAVLFLRARNGQTSSSAFLLAAWLAVAGLLAYYEVTVAAGLWGILANKPPDALVHIEGLRIGELQLIPAAILLAIWINTAWMRLRGPQLGVAALALATFACSLWDDRTPFRRLVETGNPPPELVRLMGGAGHEVLASLGRVHADLPWLWLRSPNWGAEIQGTSIVFSRPLALFWHTRMEQLTKLGLIDEVVLAPYLTVPRNPVPPFTKNAVETLCAAPDAPPMIVAALQAGSGIATGIKGSVFRLPAPEFAIAVGETGILWQRIEAYAVIKCAEVAPAKG